MGNFDVPKTPILPRLCAECTQYVEAKIAASLPGLILCEHAPNSLGAGCLAIVRTRGGQLLSFDTRWPVTSVEAAALADFVEKKVAERLDEQPPSGCH